MNTIKVGDKVDTSAPRHRWYKYGIIIEITKEVAKVEHDNGIICTYGLRQLKKVTEQ